MSYNCTRCGKEFEEYEDVIIIAVGMVESSLAFPDDFEVTLSDGPYLEVLCSTCREPKPNRVLVRVDYNQANCQVEALGVWAERPDEIMAIVSDSWWESEPDYRPGVFGSPDGLPVKQLNTAREEA